MSDALHELDARANGLLASLTPAARRTLAREIASRLRTRGQQRIAAQVSPDGTPYAPRKPQLRRKKGRIRREMFSKLRTTRFLKTEATADAAMVGFVSQVERIARVHQEGLRDRVRPGGPEYAYPARELIGISDDDRAAIEGLVLDHLSW